MDGMVLYMDKKCRRVVGSDLHLDEPLFMEASPMHCGAKTTFCTQPHQVFPSSISMKIGLWCVITHQQRSYGAWQYLLIQLVHRGGDNTCPGLCLYTKRLHQENNIHSLGRALGCYSVSFWKSSLTHLQLWSPTVWCIAFQQMQETNIYHPRSLESICCQENF